jgi:REP element-mobilizing transposase RayT
MPATHLSLYYHLIFSTKGRRCWINECWEERLYSYLGGILRRLGAVAEEIGGAVDHVHIMAGLKATHCLAEVMRDIKAISSGWVHSAIGIRLFQWQDGYGAFTVSNSDVEAMRRYIRGQKEHHRKRTFQEEYLDLLRQSGIEFDERYLW